MRSLVLVLLLAACDDGSGGTRNPDASTGDTGTFTGTVMFEGTDHSLDAACEYNPGAGEFHDLLGVVAGFGVELKWRRDAIAAPGTLTTTGGISEPITIFGYYKNTTGMNVIVNGAGMVTFTTYAPTSDGFVGTWSIDAPGFVGSGAFDCSTQ